MNAMGYAKGGHVGGVNYLQAGGVSVVPGSGKTAASTIDAETKDLQRYTKKLKKHEDAARFLPPDADIEKLPARKRAALKALFQEENPLLLTTGGFKSGFPGLEVPPGEILWSWFDLYKNDLERRAAIKQARKNMNKDVEAYMRSGETPGEKAREATRTKAQRKREEIEDKKWKKEYIKKGGYLPNPAFGGLFNLGDTDFESRKERLAAIHTSRKKMEAKIYDKRWEQVRKQYTDYSNEKLFGRRLYPGGQPGITPEITKQFEILERRYVAYQGNKEKNPRLSIALNKSLKYFEDLHLKRAGKGQARWTDTPQKRSLLAQEGKIPYLAQGGLVYARNGAFVNPMGVGIIPIDDERNLNHLDITGMERNLKAGGVEITDTGALLRSGSPSPENVPPPPKEGRKSAYAYGETPLSAASKRTGARRPTWEKWSDTVLHQYRNRTADELNKMELKALKIARDIDSGKIRGVDAWKAYRSITSDTTRNRVLSYGTAGVMGGTMKSTRRKSDALRKAEDKGFGAASTGRPYHRLHDLGRLPSEKRTGATIAAHRSITGLGIGPHDPGMWFTDNARQPGDPPLMRANPLVKTATRDALRQRRIRARKARMTPKELDRYNRRRNPAPHRVGAPGGRRAAIRANVMGLDPFSRKAKIRRAIWEKKRRIAYRRWLRSMRRNRRARGGRVGYFADGGLSREEKRKQYLFQNPGAKITPFDDIPLGTPSRSNLLPVLPRPSTGRLDPTGQSRWGEYTIGPDATPLPDLAGQMQGLEEGFQWGEVTDPATGHKGFSWRTPDGKIFEGGQHYTPGEQGKPVIKDGKVYHANGGLVSYFKTGGHAALLSKYEQRTYPELWQEPGTQERWEQDQRRIFDLRRGFDDAEIDSIPGLRPQIQGMEQKHWYQQEQLDRDPLDRAGERMWQNRVKNRAPIAPRPQIFDVMDKIKGYANGGRVPDPKRVRKPTDYFENWLRRGHYRSTGPQYKGMGVGEAPRSEEQRKARREQYLFLNPLAKETPFDFLLPQNTGTPSRSRMLTGQGGLNSLRWERGKKAQEAIEEDSKRMMRYSLEKRWNDRSDPNTPRISRLPDLASQMEGLEQGYVYNPKNPGPRGTPFQPWQRPDGTPFKAQEFNPYEEIPVV
jgi:hypothetical protein